MSKCNFTVKVKDIEEALKQAQKEAAKNSVELKGDTSKGTIKKTGVLDGKYTVSKETDVKFDLTISRWVSAFVDCAKLEKGVNDMFGKK